MSSVHIGNHDIMTQVSIASGSFCVASITFMACFVWMVGSVLLEGAVAVAEVAAAAPARRLSHKIYPPGRFNCGERKTHFMGQLIFLGLQEDMNF